MHIISSLACVQPLTGDALHWLAHRRPLLAITLALVCWAIFVIVTLPLAAVEFAWRRLRGSR